MSWKVISPDLTRNDKSKQEPSGGAITQDNTSVEYYDTVFTVAESPVQKDLLWAGTTMGWSRSPAMAERAGPTSRRKACREWSLVSLIEASPHDAGTAYVALDCHKLDDFKPYIFKTTDYGKTWTKSSAGIPEVPTSTRFARILQQRNCSMPAPRPASSSLSMAAPTGSHCS